MLISLIIPVFNEAENISHLWERLKQSLVGIESYRFEILFVDDGSTDATAANIQALAASERFAWKLVQFSRNFGHQAAISAGMQYAQGEALVFLDADLQDPPELIPVFLGKFKEGFDVVYGIRQNRKEPWWLRFCFSAFYRIFNVIADRPIPLDVGDFSLISHRVAKLIAKMTERDRLIRGMRSWVGFRQIGIPYDRPGRHAGTTSYSLNRRIEGALDGIFGFSKLPIRFVFFIGVLVFLVGGGYLASSYFMSLFGTGGVQGWKSLITLAFMLGAANLIAISIVGEYVCRIYFQTKHRPLFVVDSVTHKELDSVPVATGLVGLPTSEKVVNPLAHPALHPRLDGDPAALDF